MGRGLGDTPKWRSVLFLCLLLHSAPHPGRASSSRALKSEGQLDRAGAWGRCVSVTRFLALPWGIRVAWGNNSFPEPPLPASGWRRPEKEVGNRGDDKDPFPHRPQSGRGGGFLQAGCHFGGRGVSRQGQHPLFAAFQGEQPEREREASGIPEWTDRCYVTGAAPRRSWREAAQRWGR